MKIGDSNMDIEILQTSILKFLREVTPPPLIRWHILEGKVVKVAAANSSEDAKAQSHFVCTGHEDEKQIKEALEECEHLDGKRTWQEVRRKKEWRWPWQPKVKTTKLEGGTVLLSEGTFNITEAVDTKGIRI